MGSQWIGAMPSRKPKKYGPRHDNFKIVRGGRPESVTIAFISQETDDLVFVRFPPKKMFEMVKESPIEATFFILRLQATGFYIEPTNEALTMFFIQATESENYDRMPEDAVIFDINPLTEETTNG